MSTISVYGNYRKIENKVGKSFGELDLARDVGLVIHKETTYLSYIHGYLFIVGPQHHAKPDENMHPVPSLISPPRAAGQYSHGVVEDLLPHQRRRRSGRSLH